MIALNKDSTDSATQPIRHFVGVESNPVHRRDDISRALMASATHDPNKYRGNTADIEAAKAMAAIPEIGVIQIAHRLGLSNS